MISILSTGTELTTGDVLNTSAQTIAKVLTQEGMQIKSHLTVSDSEEEILSGVKFLFEQSQAIIVTGGLGPTSDDRTRFVLSKFTHRPLRFDENSWQAIVKRLSGFGIRATDVNRVQAMFPETSILFPNENGTAGGWALKHEDKWIFALPGPPPEAIPMLKKHVIGELARAGHIQRRFNHRWKLIGAIEADVASRVDEIAQHYPCETGYCWSYPYLDVKVFSKEIDSGSGQAAEMIDKIRTSLSTHLVFEGPAALNSTATRFLREEIARMQITILIEDQVTGGTLQKLLDNPITRSFIKWSPENHESPTHRWIIQGLNEYWSGKPFAGRTEVTVEYLHNGKLKTRNFVQIPFRGEEVKTFAAEFAAFQILKDLGAKFL